MHTVGFVKTAEFARETVDIFRRIAADDDLVQGLHGKPPSAGARCACAGAAHVRGFAGFGRQRWHTGHDNDFISKAISTATRAASRPLSVCLAMAWSSLSVVRMALAMGNW